MGKPCDRFCKKKKQGGGGLDLINNFIHTGE